MELVEHQIRQAEEFAIWLEQNPLLQKLLERPSDQASVYTEENYTFKTQLRMQVFASPVAQNIRSLFIIGENGLDIRSGTEAGLVEKDALSRLARPLLTRQNFWYSLTGNLTAYSNNKRVIAYCRTLPKLENGAKSGAIVILFSEDMFSNVIGDWVSPGEGQTLLRNSDGGILAVRGEQPEGSIMEFRSESLATGWSLTAETSSQILERQQSSLIQSALLLIVIVGCIVCGFAIYLSTAVAKPIEQIVDTVDQISQGDFSSKVHAKSDDEIGRLGRHIDDMSSSIQNLMQEQLANQTEKRHMEMRMLQTQMNPHFLYNTLSSIRVMANMQGKNSIGMMIEMLGRLLRANLAIETELIPLRTELELLDSYVYIQNIRLNGKIRYVREDVPEDIMELPVLKLLLQPIAENAILHGLSSKPGRGKLAVSARRIDDHLVIGVTDDGVGMDEEHLARARSKLCGKLEQLSAEEDGGNGIALGNVLARLRLQYGEDCEIVLHSIKGEGTTVVLRLPVQTEGEEYV